MYKISHLDLPALSGVQGDLHLPGSKSISNRLLLLSALSTGETVLHDVLDSDDTRVMLNALRTLGCRIAVEGTRVQVQGLGGQWPVRSADLFMGNAGTAIRPLTAALALLGGDYKLHGVARMHQRPIADLIDALTPLGCRITCLGQAGYPPLHIGQPELRLDAPIRVRGDVSSQFLTALLMALPLVAQRDIVIDVVGELISKPYIDITLKLLARFGVVVQRQGWSRFTIPAASQLTSPGQCWVEADASSASYFIAACALSTSDTSQNTLQVLGLGSQSIQGDVAFVEAARAMGIQVDMGPNTLTVHPATRVLRAIDWDCQAIPDAAMTLAMLALYADGPSTLRGIGSWRVKETDRITAMATELRKLGAQVDAGDDWLRVTPPASPADWRAASLATYDDHRMAMCASLAAFNPAGQPMRVLDPACVAKTFPDFFETLLTHARAPQVPVLAVDGPTASGKGTLAAALAERLGYHLLDSGALYRLCALAALRAKLALDDAPALVALAQQLPARFEAGRAYLGNEDVSEAIRDEAVGMAASRIAACPALRSALLAWQRAWRRLPGLVADGRDMGSVVFPDATLKVFLTASATARAQRRHAQVCARGGSVTLESLCADLNARDAADANRPVAPLKPSADALLLDNSTLSVQASLDRVLSNWQSRWPFQA